MRTMTTWKPRKKAAKRQKVFTIGLAVLTFFCGIVAGEWWGDQHSKAHQLTAAFESTKGDLAKAKVELEQGAKASDSQRAKISDMHHNLEAVLLRFFNVYREHSKIDEAAAERARFQGLRVAPNTTLKVLAPAPNSGVFDLA